MFNQPRENGVRQSQMEYAHEFLGKQRCLFLYGGITMGDMGGLRLDKFGAMVICDQMLALDALNHEPITLYITSGGGAIPLALNVYDTMKSIKSPVHTVCRYAASAATLLLAAGERGHRYMYKNSRIMIHQPSQYLGTVTESEGRQRTKELTLALKNIAELYVECGAVKDVKAIIKDLRAKDYWMSTTEAIEYGLVDKVVQ